jgi:c-di-GMP-related signal transduction protein
VQPGKKLVAECKYLKEAGYVIALEDYIHQAVWHHFLPYIDIIKIKFMETSYEQMEDVKVATQDLPNIMLLAEKV